MKKLMLLALMLVAAPAFAQNTATTTQSGNDHSSNIAQTGSNTATVNQEGLRHSAEITQIGTSNVVTSDQSNGTLSTNRDNDFEAFQDGSGNEVISRQAGRNNLTDTYQLGNDNRVSTESGQVGADIRGISHETIIRQVGNENEALTRTGGEYRNRTTITQGDDLAGSFGSAARARYDGQDNTVTMEQYGTGNNAGVNIVGDDNTVDLDQIGNSNTIDLDGGSWGDYGVNMRGSHNAVTAWQEGDGNDAYIRIGLTGTGNHDDENAVGVRQEGNLNTADVRIRGDLNAVGVHQLNGNLNTATVSQLGNSNRVEGLGGLGTAALQDGFDHTLTVSQTGDFNVAQSSQVGSDNTAIITQN